MELYFITFLVDYMTVMILFSCFNDSHACMKIKEEKAENCVGINYQFTICI